MRITSVESIPVRLRIRPELAIRAKGGYHSGSRFLLVKEHTDKGIIGLGTRALSRYIGRLFCPLPCLKRSPGSRIRLEEREGVTLRILTHSIPSHTRQTNLAYQCFAAAFLDEIGARIDCRNFDSDANGLARVFTSSEPTV